MASAPLVGSSEPEAIAPAQSPAPAAQAAPSIDAPYAKSEAALRFGWDPAMPDEPAPASSGPSARLDADKTVSETALPAPELEALFAALEAAPIRIKPSTPEPVVVPDAPPEPPPIVAAPAAFEPAPPVAFESTASFEERAQLPAPAAEKISATINLQAAISAATFEGHGSVAPPHVADVVAPEPPSTPAEDAFTPIKIRMPVFDTLPPAGPALPVDLAPAEPRAATPPPAEAAAPVLPPTELAAAAPVVAAAGLNEAPAAVETPAAAVAPAASARPAAKPAPKPTSRRSLVTAAAAVVILGAIGVPLSRLWLERAAAQPAVQVVQPVQQPAPQRPAPAARTATPAAAPAPAPAAAPTPSPAPPAAAAPVARRERAASVAAPSPKVTAAATPRPPVPDAAPRASAPPKPTRPATTAAPPQASPALATLAPAIVTPNVTALPSAPVEPEPAPLPADPSAAPAAGPFFELNDVDRPPKVATRVDAALPASMQGQVSNEIVVVRVLVSQTGRPALVSLLRHSRSGLALDEAVIAAVKQWTFTPAVKRGQNVSCFYHVGVPVGPGR
jgi:TonB family protein